MSYIRVQITSFMIKYGRLVYTSSRRDKFYILLQVSK